MLFKSSSKEAKKSTTTGACVLEVAEIDADEVSVFLFSDDENDENISELGLADDEKTGDGAREGKWFLIGADASFWHIPTK